MKRTLFEDITKEKVVDCDIECRDCIYLEVHNPDYHIDEDRKIWICKKYNMRIQ